MLISRAVTFEYDKSNQFHFPDINLPEGTNLLVLGDSGIGKTTLLHLTAGLLKPKSGSIEIDRTDIMQLEGKDLDRFRGAHIGIIFQKPYFIQSLTLRENLELIQYLGNRAKDGHRIKLVLDDLGLLGKMNTKPQYLSQGEQQRAGIALAVINQPKLILADEPTSALDDKNCRRVIELLKNQTKKNKCSLMIITHDQRLKTEFENSIKLASTNQTNNLP
ncbi:ABC transporter ATP-binding protein [Algoriphagus vanfongensis]|uniref:ABC transporter ATP-binding protein n=1 Tax=Algoriphagus vanfongensis TaxID=426371 RepID=UPI0004168413|nr:ATP-binding cassette domain-containing protein [Algoriphagus vanfongensis]